GRQLQLVLYAIAAQEMLRKGKVDAKAMVASGRYLFPTVKGAGEDKLIRCPDDEVTAAVLSELCDTLRAGAFTVTPDEEDCKFCNFKKACGGAAAIERAKTMIKEGAGDVLEPFRRLRSHG
ncbi:MAG: PD-(D/E)XK nuclease family protein, partial [Planctomycetes bacterium]|nr:PD-(D/E)XK nuclease family protein [Planctomycetota bacterium]